MSGAERIMPHVLSVPHAVSSLAHQSDALTRTTATSWLTPSKRVVRDRPSTCYCSDMSRHSVVQRRTERAHRVVCSGFRQTQVSACTAGGKYTSRLRLDLRHTIALQDQLKQSRTTQVASTQLLAKLLEAPNTSATAKKHVDEINEEFFMVASTYMDMVRTLSH